MSEQRHAPRNTNGMHTDADLARAAREQLIPFVLHLYGQAALEVPELFDARREGPLVVAALREQGFASQLERDCGKEDGR